jgi:dTDP-4-dehydrorhamnose 3,5-epimerase-like enzyme
MKSNHLTHNDKRGSFTAIDSRYLDINWEQFNVVTNKNKFTFRGLHYQTNPPQTKCIKVVQGKILDIWVDLKTEEVHTFELNNSHSLFIPNNYAHGYLTLEPNTIVTYLVKGNYNPDSEHSIVWKTIPKVKNIIEDYSESNKIYISKKDETGK